ncbi:hypothetical protein EV195_11233 [Tenacibaculum skagerrakense]|uniref:Uncharacterized protein n=1 Tax=Tenacibaculum skagerrakense TaxID=186571 RepID=A0A4R2NMB2_9FLAO|nr:hypothetical protein [Tenacibaculum skagerrakense]TCP22384.1 hypothetical protein EV195_11233 [Tenacibaculum skagerrakense]
MIKEFNALNGKDVSREELQKMIAKAKKKNNTEVVYRLSKILLDNPQFDTFTISVKKYPTALNAPYHVGAYKEALTENGKLRKGWRFVKGRIVKTAKIPKPSKKEGLQKSGRLKKGYKYAKGGKIVKITSKKKD